MLMILKTPSQKMLKSGSKNLRHRFLKWTVKLNNYHQKSIVFLSLILICTFFYYAFKVDPHSSLMEDLSKGNELYDDMIFMEQKMGSVMPLEVIATVNNKGAPFENGIKDPKTLHAIAKLQDKLSTIPEIGKMISVIDYLREINQAFNEGDKEYNPHKIISQAKMRYQSLLSRSLRVTVPMNLELEAGDIVDIKLIESMKGTDEWMSGLYIIKDLKHSYITRKNGVQCYTYLRLIKDTPGDD